ncbi:FAD-dependent oxidoreductase [Cellulomonas sp. HZM]|uniref:FAD-dependent oxidoreductase n=1 Tax=Cellulomonas sp. HZM TaxID=1454010 RepID=UPI0006907B1F|nr:FAD-dependent oxidoreductase [Cellulomonas sp. HZM]
MSHPSDASRDPRRVVVVGAGLAATQTVAALRERGFDGHVTVLGDEGRAPYDRPPLSKHLLDRREPAWLADELGADLMSLADDVRLALPAHGLRADDAAATVATRAGDVTADVVVVASGARPRRPADWSDALVLHTAADADVLRARLRPGTRLVVVGAGWIGAEVAGVAAAAGVEVTVLEAGPAPLSGALGVTVGGLLAPAFAHAGVRLVTSAQVVDVRGDGVDVVGPAGRERIGADVVLAAVGAGPATDWLGDALPRERSGALRVDETYRVLGAARTVRAVGDVALRRSHRHGWVPPGHWDGALRGPVALVDDLLGVPGAPADPAPYVFSTQLGHELTLFGLPGTDDDVVLRGTPGGTDGWTALWWRPGTDVLTATLTVDRPRDVAAARRLFGATDLPRLDPALAADAGTPLRSALRDQP